MGVLLGTEVVGLRVGNDDDGCRVGLKVGAGVGRGVVGDTDGALVLQQ